MMPIGRKKDARYVLSLGAGINSTALMIWLIENRWPFDEAVFADTGGEVPETYRTVRQVKRYLREHDIPLHTVRSTRGTLYECCWRRKVIPSQIWRWSTRDFKVNPIYKYYKSFGVHVYQYVGIARDEVHRMRESREPSVTNLYPLVDAALKRNDCIEIIREAKFPMPVRSGCYFCPFNSPDRWAWLFEAHPDLYNKAMRLEQHSKHYPDQRLATPTLKVLARKINRGELDGGRSEEPCGSECMT